MPRRQTDIEDVNALIGQVHESLLEQREQDRIAPLWPHTPQSLHRLFAPQTRQEFLAVWIESRHFPWIDCPLLEQGELAERNEQGWWRSGRGMLPEPGEEGFSRGRLGNQQVIE